MAALMLLVLARVFLAYLPVDYSPPVTEKKAMDAKLLEFTLGEKGDEVVKRAGFPIKRSRVATALLYDASRTASGVEPIFRLRHPQHVLEFPRATDVEFYDGAEDTLGITHIDVIIKLPAAPKRIEDPHGPEVEAYDRAVYELVRDLLTRIRAAGFKRYLGPDDPRLQGAVTYPLAEGYARYRLDRGMRFYADPDYALTWDDWHHLDDSIRWSWHAPGMFFDLSYMRDPRMIGEPLLETLQATLETESSFVLQYGADGDDLAAAKIAFGKTLPKFLKERAEREAQARALGLPIFENYQDPAIGGIPVPKPE